MPAAESRAPKRSYSPTYGPGQPPTCWARAGGRLGGERLAALRAAGVATDEEAFQNILARLAGARGLRTPTQLKALRAAGIPPPPPTISWV